MASSQMHNTCLLELRRMSKAEDVLTGFEGDFSLEKQNEFIEMIELDKALKRFPLPQKYLASVFGLLMEKCHEDISDKLGEALAATFLSSTISDEESAYLSFEVAPNRCVAVRCYNRKNELGLRLWPAAEMLAAYIATNPLQIVKSTIIELGSGVGLCGLVAAGLTKKDVTLTDCDELVLCNLRCLIEDSNLTHCCQAKYLDWTTFDTRNDFSCQQDPMLIIAADCVYDPIAADALARVLALFARKGATIWLANEVRDPDTWNTFIQSTLKSHRLRILDDFSAAAVDAIDSLPADSRLLAPSVWRRLRASALNSSLRLLSLSLFLSDETASVGGNTSS